MAKPLLKVLIYRSAGTDEMKIACRTVEEAINCFRADAEMILQDGGQYLIQLRRTEMSEEQFAKAEEM